MTLRAIALALLLAGPAAAAAAPAPTPSAFADLKPAVVLKLGATADWVLAAGSALWVGSTGPFAVHRIDPKTNRVSVRTLLPGEPCAGLAAGFGSLWVPLCSEPRTLARVDLRTGRLAAVLPIGPTAGEGGITASPDSLWLVTDHEGALARIDPMTGRVRQVVHVPSGSFNPRYSDGIVWVTQHEGASVTPVDARTGRVLAAVPTGPAPRFLASAPGSVWVLSQDDGAITHIDTRRRAVTATIEAGLKGHGGDIAFGDRKVWATVSGTPLTEIDATTDRVLHQWVGPGGDSLAFAYGAIWVTDYKNGLVARYPLRSLVSP
jgi:streptogramin lyase